jgi:hypothetical protein
MLTRMSFAVIRKDSEMIWFPVLAGLLSILFSAALFVPTFALGVFAALGLNESVAGVLKLIVVFVTYFGLAFITTFFNMCIVYTTKVRISGGDATFGESIAFSFSRIHLILGWSLVSATVGLFFFMLDSIAEKAGLLGKILLYVLRTILASAWAITTMFVIPSMAYKGLGPFDAIKDSVHTLRQTWGENLIRHYGLGLASFVCALPCLILVALGSYLTSVVPALGLAAIGLGVIALIVVSVLFNMANTVFKTALYAWASGATQGYAPQGFDPEFLQGVFTQRA